MKNRGKIAVDRRKILKVTGAAGIGGLGTTKGVRGEVSGTKETAKFVEMNVSFRYDSPTITPSDEYTPLEFYSIKNNKLTFAAAKEPVLKKFAENESVVRFNGYHNIPNDFSSREYDTLGISPNNRLSNKKGILLAGSVSVPSIQTKMENNNLLVKSEQKVLEVPPEDSGSLDLEPVKAESRTGEIVEAVPMILANNHGELDVSSDKILGGGA